MDQTVEHSNGQRGAAGGPESDWFFRHAGLIVVLFAAAVFVGCMVSPPSLMDDVDAVQAQIARNFLQSGDWVIAHLDGVPYIEKSPLNYWIMALCFWIFGAHDWAARIPNALTAVLLAWMTFRYGRWAFGQRAGFFAGLCLATSTGLFMFTRIQIPDVMITLTVGLAFWSFQRASDPEEPHPRWWAAALAACLGVGLLLKGLIALVAPVGGIFVYLAVTRQLFSRDLWRRLHVFSGLLLLLAIAAPWHILAMRRMPPYFDFTLHSGPGEYRGFFWFYFINEHVLRFLNLRYPRDYNTVPRAAFWLFHLLWLFPWSAFFPGAAALGYKPVDRAGRTRLLALCWCGFLLTFFTFSTTQEYYSMPIYPALALLLGCVMAGESRWLRIGSRTVGVISAAAAAVIAAVLFLTRHLPAPGDISRALEQHPDSYTLSLGHMGDLTLHSFAYLRTPLVLAGLAMLLGAVAAWRLSVPRVYLAFALMMVLFFQAARVALVVFDPFMGSRPLAEALLRAPQGRLILNDEYYGFSSVFFYTNRSALLLNGRRNNLEYGSYAPGSPNVFIDDVECAALWMGAERFYVLTTDEKLEQLKNLVGGENLHPVAESGGKFLFTNK
jgi:4-amino-4-deoxy-L-arabinose transferase-like glycosyltransferase